MKKSILSVFFVLAPATTSPAKLINIPETITSMATYSIIPVTLCCAITKLLIRSPKMNNLSKTTKVIIKSAATLIGITMTSLFAADTINRIHDNAQTLNPNWEQPQHDTLLPKVLTIGSGILTYKLGISLFRDCKSLRS